MTGCYIASVCPVCDYLCVSILTTWTNISHNLQQYFQYQKSVAEPELFFENHISYCI